MLRADRIARLVLESASPGLAHESERRDRRAHDEALARRIETEGVAAWVDAWEGSPLFAGRAALAAEVREPFLALRRANRPAALAAWLREMGSGSQPSFWQRLREVRVCTLLITGASDARYTEVADRMTRALPHARHAVIPGAGHIVHLEALAAWLRDRNEINESNV